MLERKRGEKKEEGRGKTLAASLNKPCRIMLPLPRKPKAGGFETGGRVFSAGLPSVRDPVCLAAELVLLKGCWKGPEPGTAVVMFVWLKEEPAFVEGGKKKRETEQFKQSDHKKEDEMGRCPSATGTHMRARFVEINNKKGGWEGAVAERGARPRYSFNYSLPTKCAGARLDCTVQISGKPAPLSGNGVG